MMRHALKCLGLVSVGLLVGCEPKSADLKGKPPAAKAPDLLARYHFVGTRQLLENPQVPMLKAIAELRETGELRQKTLERLAAAKIVALTGDANAATSNRVAMLLPMMEDWLASESFLEARGAPDRPMEITLAVRLDAARVGTWKKQWADFSTAAELGTPVDIAPEGFPGWEVKLKRAPHRLRFVGAGAWALLGLGSDDLPTLAQAVARCKAGEAPAASTGTNVLTAELNLPRLAGSWGLPEFFQGPPGQWPQVAVAVNAAGGNLRSRMRLTYAQALTWRLEKWNLPTNMMRDPLISFTAMQPIASWLTKAAVVRELGIQPLPNQAFLWAQSVPPKQSSAAVPVADANKVLTQIGTKLPYLVNTNLAKSEQGQILWATNLNHVVWDGLLGLVPALRPAVEPNAQFVTASLFPTFANTNPPPEGLMAQFVGRTNLVYYDWEITQTRLDQLRLVAYMAESNLRRHRASTPGDLPVFSPRRPAQKFLAAILPRLSRDTDRGREGESITEITLTSSRELTLVRRSPVGLTALEFIGLSWWLESPSFPRLSPASASSGQPAKAR